VNKGTVGCGVIVAFASLLMATWVGSYNRLVDLDEEVDLAWGQLDGAYQQRADLVPDLVAAAKAIEGLEQGTWARAVEAHTEVTQINVESAPDAEQLAQFEAAQGRLSMALSRVLVVARDPELEAAEIRIALERERFNDATLAYNKTRRRFPTILLANVAGFGDRPYPEATPAR